MEITIKRLYECSLEQVLQAWNEGFEGYFTDATMNVEMFTRRMVLDGLSPRLSLVAFVDGEPAGVVLNGVRMARGKKISTNSGTGVATRFRGTGVSRALLDAMLDVYREEGVEIATLEAITQNERAIALYEKYGYAITGHVTFLQHGEALWAITTNGPAYT